VTDRRRRRLSHAAIHLTAALGPFVVASTGLAAVRRMGLYWLLLNHPPPHPSA
jgi:hypothetical protein